MQAAPAAGRFCSNTSGLLWWPRPRATTERSGSSSPRPPASRCSSGNCHELPRQPQSRAGRVAPAISFYHCSSSDWHKLLRQPLPRAASELLQTPPSCVAPAAAGPSCSGSLSHYAPPWQQLIKAAPAASVPSCACANEPSCPGSFRIALLLIRAATAASVSRQQQLNRVAPAASALRCN